MNRKFISELGEGEEVEGLFFLVSKKVKVTRTGESYLDLLLQDKTGTITGKLWNIDTSKEAAIKEGFFLRVRGTVDIYNNNKQLIITVIEKVEPDTVDLRDFVSFSPRSIDELKEEFKEIISSIKNFYLRKLLEILFSNQKFADAFFKTPAAKKLHHAYWGGLAEHSILVARLSQLVAEFMIKEGISLDIDLILCGALLHDIGKIKELKFTPAIDYTTPGRLLGHITFGTIIIDRAIKKIENFPPDLETVLKHIIISHHSDPDKGSPVKPQTKEALLVHHIDYLSSQLFIFERWIEKFSPGEWTEYNKILDRFIYKWEGGS